MTLRYPSQLNEGTTDYVVFSSEEYRSNNSTDGSPPAIGDSIILYMPNSTPALGNENSWGGQPFEGPLGQIKRDLMGAAANITSEVGKPGGMSAITEDLTKKFEARKSEVGPIARQLALNMVGGAFGFNPNSILAIQRGEIYNPNIELIYQGPKLRSFSFDYNFIPKSAAETNSINSIIMAFKKNSSPTQNGGMLKVPHVWNIKYMTGGAQNRYMNAFKKCALMGVTVQYNAGSDMHQTFTDGMPVTTSLQLSFQEVDIILSDDHDQAGTVQGY